jgi:hypothetical protein
MPIILQHLTFSNKKLEDTNSGTAWPTISTDWNVILSVNWTKYNTAFELHQTVEERCKFISSKHGIFDKK